MNSHSSVQVSYRYERKFATHRHDYREVETMVRLHPAMFFEVYPPRYVNSMYLESADFRSYDENMGGLSARSKYRIRWYDDLKGWVDQPILEVKLKRSDLGTKKRFPLPGFSFDDELSPTSIKKLVDEAKVPDPTREFCVSRDPIVVVRYRRKYFLSKDRKFRITIDWKLEYYGRRPGSRGFRKKTKPGSVIVELKYDRENSDQASLVSTGIPLRLYKNSKYVHAVLSTYGIR